MSVKFSNNGHSTLAASLTNSATSITVASGHGARFPSLSSGEYFYATLIDSSNNLEIVKVTARSSDVLTATRAQEGTTARAYAIGDRIELRVTAQGITDASNPYDKDSSSTGYFDLPVGTTAQQPGNGTGRIRFDTDIGAVTFNDGSNWLKIAAAIAQLTGVSGNIFDGQASTLTLTGTGFLTASLVVNFKQTSDSIDANVTVTPSSDTAATVTVPSSVYSNVTAGNVVEVKVTNSDGSSSPAVNKTALALPSGGTVTSSGGFRIHTFTSSGTFVNTVASLQCQFLVIAGGGGGGGSTAGGGGAGGYRCSVPGETSGGQASAESVATVSAASHSISVGAGGTAGQRADAGNPNNTGGSNSVFSGGSITSIGGGKGYSGHGTVASTLATSGGSGGGGGGYVGNPTNPRSDGGAGTSGQGTNGGNGINPAGNHWGGGGGGGAGAAGSPHVVDNASRTGGAGQTSSISGSAQFRAGGGGGGCTDSGTNGTARTSAGGSGGGGNGADGQQATTGAGSVNTGSGGGGGGYYQNGGGGAGGSGIVIIRYQL